MIALVTDELFRWDCVVRHRDITFWTTLKMSTIFTDESTRIPSPIIEDDCFFSLFLLLLNQRYELV